MNSNNIFKNLSKYFQGIANQLSSIELASSVFPNSADIGDARENILLKFLQTHLPTRCSATKGGFIFNSDGKTSKQIDIMIVTDFSLNFKHFNHSETSKTFQSIEGTLAAISVKSDLSKDKLFDALEGLTSIPRMPADMLEKINPQLKGREEYLSLPKKIVFAFTGPHISRVLTNITEFYQENPSLEKHQMANLVIVNNKYCVQRIGPGGGTTRNGTVVAEGTFHPMWSEENLKEFGALPLLWLVMHIQRTTIFTPHIIFDFQKYFDKFNFHDG